MTRTARRVLALVAIAAIALPLTSASAKVTRTETKEYVGSYDPISPSNCDLNDDLGVNVGMVCFAVKLADKRVDITVTDLINPDTGFFWILKDSSGACAEPSNPDDPLGACDSAGFGCPVKNGITVPNNARRLDVYPSGVVLGPTVCTVVEGVASPGAGTAGEVEVKFRDN